MLKLYDHQNFGVKRLLHDEKMVFGKGRLKKVIFITFLGKGSAGAFITFFLRWRSPRPNNGLHDLGAL